MRSRKLKKIETVKHGSFGADIRFDKDNGSFICECNGGLFQSNILQEVRNWAYKSLVAASTADWKPVMMEACSKEVAE